MLSDNAFAIIFDAADLRPVAFELTVDGKAVRFGKLVERPDGELALEATKEEIEAMEGQFNGE